MYSTQVQDGSGLERHGWEGDREIGLCVSCTYLKLSFRMGIQYNASLAAARNRLPSCHTPVVSVTTWGYA